ncbi:Cyanovirin-N [Cladorrhinum samala]|uniref:Cyanovirin-N n=1 Tax=Cladorrhinum samala TaxID=585594 RepID=A0AAV9HUK6_9PEZI|nr:Cyanovirin-N [Cladorrhinum samala]
MGFFHASAEDIRVDDGHILRARLKTEDGGEHDSEIDLNQYIGNNNGNFDWGGVNFSHSAQNISFSIEGADGVPVLRAELADAEGNYHARDINLSECIGNNNGNFSYDG